MRLTSHGLLRLGMGLLCGCGAAVWGAATTTTYIGPAAPADWNTAGYWDNGIPATSSPSGPAWSVVFTTAADFTSTANVPTALVGITTGAGLVKFPAAMGTISAGTGYSPGGSVTVGSGGLTFNGSIGYPYGSSALTIGGNFAATGISWGNNGTITQTGGLISVGSFVLPLGGAFSIPALSFAAGYPTTISGGGTPSANYTFTGTPTFAGGLPIWNLTSGYTGGGSGKWDLNGRTMAANTVNVIAGGSPSNRYAYLVNTVAGGTVDANKLLINPTGYTYEGAYINLHNANVTLRGAGLIYENRSVNNNGANKTMSSDSSLATFVSAFDIRDNTLFTLDPAAGTAQISTGSKDRGGDGVQPADWVNNFAFWNITLGTGDVITLTGNATIEGLGTSALYAHYLSGSGTIDLNGHNVYLDEYPASTVLFTGTGTVYAIPEPASLALLGLAGLLCVRNSRRV